MLVAVLLSIILFANALPFMNPSTKHIREDLLRLQTHKERQGITYPKAQWFTQELDHFNVQERRTWQQRYFVNDTFFQKGKNGPIFVQVGGEGAISPGYVVDLMMAHYAAAEGALILALEHRFYGESHPFPTLDTPNLVFLTSEQALADLSVFLAAIKKEYPTTGPIITFGGSYPGNLASWFRLKYPHVTKGAIASSAPVLAVLDMVSYLDVVEKSLEKLGGIACDNAIQNATSVIQDFLTTQEGRKTIENLFQTCSPIVSDKDISTFMSNVMGNWMGVVQYNQESPRMPNITGLCAIMTDKTNDPFANYLKVANSFLPPNGCLPVSYTDTVKQLQDVNAFGPSVGERQWTYQTCTEFGYFQSTDSLNQPFGDLVPLSYYTDLCKDVFGFNWLPRIDETNVHYGGLKPGSTNVVFVNGNIDPWHSLSILESQSDTLLAILIDGTAHCANMKPATANDPPGLAQAQQQIAKILHGWVSK